MVPIRYEGVAGKGWIEQSIVNDTKLSGLGQQIMDGEGISAFLLTS